MNLTKMKPRTKRIGKVSIPKSMSEYCERHMDKLIVEQCAFDACNGYALGFNTTVSIKRYAEYCPICGYHSLWNPNQKRLLAENQHRLERKFETIFCWDADSSYDSLAKSFHKFIEEESA